MLPPLCNLIRRNAYSTPHCEPIGVATVEPRPPVDILADRCEFCLVALGEPSQATPIAEDAPVESEHPPPPWRVLCVNHHAFHEQCVKNLYLYNAQQGGAIACPSCRAEPLPATDRLMRRYVAARRQRIDDAYDRARVEWFESNVTNVTNAEENRPPSAASSSSSSAPAPADPSGVSQANQVFFFRRGRRRPSNAQRARMSRLLEELHDAGDRIS
jgi:hypothetical protein